MNNRALILASAVAFALSACDSKQPSTAPTPPSAPAPVVQAPAAPPQPMAQAGPDAAARDALHKKHPNPKKCPDDECKIIVTATACDKNSIKADPPVLVPEKKNVKIVWKVTSPGYTFDRASGIELKDANTQFKCKDRADPTEYECKNKNDDIREYEYAITLVKDGKTCATDPIIINGY